MRESQELHGGTHSSGSIFLTTGVRSIHNDHSAVFRSIVDKVMSWIASSIQDDTHGKNSSLRRVGDMGEWYKSGKHVPRNAVQSMNRWRLGQVIPRPNLSTRPSLLATPRSSVKLRDLH